MFLPTEFTTPRKCDEELKSIDNVIKSQTVDGEPVPIPNTFTADFTDEETNLGEVDFETVFNESISVTRVEVTSEEDLDEEDTWKIVVEDQDGNTYEEEGVR